MQAAPEEKLKTDIGQKPDGCISRYNYVATCFSTVRVTFSLQGPLAETTATVITLLCF